MLFYGAFSTYIILLEGNMWPSQAMTTTPQSERQNPSIQPRLLELSDSPVSQARPSLPVSPASAFQSPRVQRNTASAACFTSPLQFTLNRRSSPSIVRPQFVQPKHLKSLPSERLAVDEDSLGLHKSRSSPNLKPGPDLRASKSPSRKGSSVLGE